MSTPSLSVVWTGTDATGIPPFAMPAGVSGEFVLLRVSGATDAQTQAVIAAANELGTDLVADPHITPAKGIHILGTAGVIPRNIANGLSAVEPIIEAELHGGKLSIWSLLGVIGPLASAFGGGVN